MSDLSESQRGFLKLVLCLFAIVSTVFLLEFLWEWQLAGRPDLADLRFNEPKGPKPADFLSPAARAYNNILAMVLATIAIAIPLTANMYTAKLIDIFLRDRVNQFMLFFWAILAAHVLWVLYLVSPGFTPAWMIRVAVAGALLGWIMLIPYFYYIVGFLDPTRILARIRDEAILGIGDGESPSHMRQVQSVLHQRLHHIGTIILKTIDRGERAVTLEGIECFQQILNDYHARKQRMSAEWFHLDRRDFVGLSAEALAILQEDKTWVEHRVLSLIFLAYQAALAKTQDVVSSISEASRAIALDADQRGDDKALELSVRFFNNYLRESIKRKDIHAIYDLCYQYQLLAKALCHRPALVKKIGGYFRIYSRMAEASGLGFVTQLMAVDLSRIVRHAYEQQCPAGGDLLEELQRMGHAGEDRALVVKVKLALGGFFLDKQFSNEVAKVRANLSDVPPTTLAALGNELLTMEDRSFWEVTDRQIMLEWTPPSERPGIQRFLDTI